VIAINRDRKRFYIIAAVFVLLLLIGTVYAATTGLLAFGGTAGFNTNVRLNIVGESIADPAGSESETVNAAKDTLTFALRLSAPGDTRQIKFKIENAGNYDAVLSSLSTTPPAAGSGITVTWPSLNGVQILTGTTSSEYTITVQWNPSYPNVTQDVTLSASINYQQYAP
jgi:hypothetical protein